MCIHADKSKHTNNTHINLDERQADESSARSLAMGILHTHLELLGVEVLLLLVAVASLALARGLVLVGLSPAPRRPPARCVPKRSKGGRVGVCVCVCGGEGLFRAFEHRASVATSPTDGV